MDRVNFCVKRTHWSYVTHANRAVREWLLTAARIDLLVAHRDALLHYGIVYQCNLRARLGVTSATICVMLRRMERLGLIEQKRDDRDRRRNIVTVTAAGYAAMESARPLIDNEYRETIDFSLFRIDFKSPLPEKRSRFLLYLDTIREVFGDLTEPPYPREPHPKIVALITRRAG